MTGVMQGMPCSTMCVRNYDFLLDVIDEYRECAGVFNDEERREFVEQFLEWKMVGGVQAWHPIYGWGRALREWVCEILDREVADTVMGKRITACLMAGLEGGTVEATLFHAIKDVAEDLETSDE